MFGSPHPLKSVYFFTSFIALVEIELSVWHWIEVVYKNFIYLFFWSVLFLKSCKNIQFFTITYDFNSSLKI